MGSRQTRYSDWARSRSGWMPMNRWPGSQVRSVHDPLDHPSGAEIGGVASAAGFHIRPVSGHIDPRMTAGGTSFRPSLDKLEY